MNKHFNPRNGAKLDRVLSYSLLIQEIDNNHNNVINAVKNSQSVDM